MQRSQQGCHTNIALTISVRRQRLYGRPRDTLSLIDTASANEGMRKPKVPSEDIKRLIAELRSSQRPISGNPSGIRLILTGKGGGSRLIRPALQAIKPRSILNAEQVRVANSSAGMTS